MTSLRPPPEHVLKPCPFCGSRAEKDGYGYYYLGNESFVVRCSNDACRVRPSILQSQSEYGEWDLEEEWNERRPDAIVPDAADEKQRAAVLTALTEEGLDPHEDDARSVLTALAALARGDGT